MATTLEHLETYPTFRALRKALPRSEFEPVSAWLTCFYPFQLRWLLDWSRFAILNKSRKIGGSFSLGASAILWSLFGDTSTVVSIGEREATLVLDHAERHAKVLKALGSSWADSRRTSTDLTLASGGKVIALPSSSGARGYDGHVILDEYAYHEHPEKVWDAAAGAITLKRKLRVCSTPNGVGNLFHTLCTDPKASEGYEHHTVTIDDAIAEGYPIDEADLWRQAHGDARVFDQMFRCKFLDGAMQYIPSELIQAALVEQTGIWDGVYYAGIDVGRVNNLTCLVIVGVDGEGVHWVQIVETRKRTTEDDLHALCALALGSKWGCVRVCIDATGIGAFPAENLQKKFGRQRIEPVSFTQQSKEDMATTLYQRFADKKLRLPSSNRELRDDIASLKRIITSAGNVRYDAPATERGHADRAWALALALHGCSKPPNYRHEEYA
jgi:phage FluMu gp28-like protein